MLKRYTRIKSSKDRKGMALFSRTGSHPQNNNVTDFSYLSPEDIYLDTACQTMRPQAVIEAMQKYYHEYNACGGRVKYEWGRKVDDEIASTRARIMSFLGKSDKIYLCAFTLNTSYGLNLLLGQLPEGRYSQIITSDIEHNSVFLPTMTAAKRLGIPRKVLSRELDGTLNYTPSDLGKSVVVLNTTSNIDGRELRNAVQLAKDIHNRGGILILDAAQSMAHNPGLLKDIDFDALCFSGHKMYGPSIGAIIVKNDLHAELIFSFIGGGTVEDVQLDSFTLLRDDPVSHFESGLQDFAGIIGLGAAIDWLGQYKPEGKAKAVQQHELATQLFEGIKDLPSTTVLNAAPTPIISFYSDKLDAHRLAVYLSAQKIMARSGYFCCHYYLHVKNDYPPLLRLSLGLNNTSQQISTVLSTIKTILERA